METDELLYSSDSLLSTVELKDIVNSKTFETLIPDDVKDQLILLLPNCDVQDRASLLQLFDTHEFHHSLYFYQRHLIAGTFDTKPPNHSSRSKKKKDENSWKEQYFERYWGQRSIKDTLLTTPPLSTPNFSFSNNDIIADSSLPSKPTPTTAQSTSLKSCFNINKIDHSSTEKKKVNFADIHKPGAVDEDDSDEEFHPKPSSRPRKPPSSSSSSSSSSSTTAHHSTAAASNNHNSKKGKVSFRSMALEVLQRVGKPLQPKEIIAISIKEDNFVTCGKTPENTLASVLYKEIQLKNPPSPFVKLNTKPTTFGLREWNLPT